MEKEYYLDTAATTYVADEVIGVITDTMRNIYGNPSSLHTKGRQAHEVVNKATKIIADYIKCKPSEIVFTSGACEANSLAILGFIRKHKNIAVIQSIVEHKSIALLRDSNAACDEKILFNHVKVDTDGVVRLDDLETQLQFFQNANYIPLVTIQAANSEIGAIQHIKEIAQLVHRYNGIYHCDATQLFPYQKIDVKELGIDMMSVSGQKIHAPKGIGFLYVKQGIELEPLIYGTQNRSMRGGTENVPYIVGLGKAIQLLDKTLSEQELEHPQIYYVRNYLMNRIKENIDNCMINGSFITERLPNNINVSFKGVDAQSLIILLDTEGIYVSAGSACDAHGMSVSHVLQAIQVPNDYIKGTIRITLPDDFGFEDADYVVERLTEHVRILRKFGVNE